MWLQLTIKFLFVVELSWRFVIEIVNGSSCLGGVPSLGLSFSEILETLLLIVFTVGFTSFAYLITQGSGICITSI